jgi:group I intron endonuclease
MINSGVYKIVNLTNGDFYVGSSIDMHERWSGHKRAVRIGRTKCPHLYSAMRKYGINNFAFQPLIICEESDIKFYEQRLLDTVVGLEECYNVSLTADAPMRGRTHSLEARKKLSVSRIGKANPMLGRHHSEETKKKISLIRKTQSNNQLGLKRTKQQIKNIRTGRWGLEYKSKDSDAS